MKANPNGETMIGVLKQINSGVSGLNSKIDKLTDEVNDSKMVSKNIEEHHKRQARPHRVLFYVTVVVAILASVTFYFEIIRYTDLDIFKDRIAEVKTAYESKTLIAGGSK